MRALVCTELGPASKLSVADLDDPHPGPGEIVIDVEAAGLNFPDTLIIQGMYQFKPELPFTPGGEACGVVSAVGEGVSRLSAGDRVIAMQSHGAFAERWVVPEAAAIPAPEGLAPSEAAAFMMTYGTSYHALKDRARLRPGETLLVLGAAGGVGSAAVELGKVLGAEVIAAASSAEKLSWAEDLGADHLIDYSTQDLRDRIREITHGDGVDVVYDPVGGDFTEAAIRSTAWNGRVLIVGFPAGIASIPMNLPLLKGMSIVGVFWGRHLDVERELHIANMTELGLMVADGRIRPRVSAEFALDDYEEAFGMLTGRSVMGKAVFRLA